jgi:hypothetical protein
MGDIQPAVVTTEPETALLPAVGPGIHTLTPANIQSPGTRTLTVSAGDDTTVILQGQDTRQTAQNVPTASQPAAVTTQPEPNSNGIPAVGPGIHTLTLAAISGAGSRTIVVSAGSDTTIQLSDRSSIIASTSLSTASSMYPSRTSEDWH